MSWRKMQSPDETFSGDPNALPPLDVPVWLYDPELGQPLVGALTVDDGHYSWGRCYDDFWWDKDTREWKCSTVDVDDLNPTHWQPLPLPPT